MAHHAHLVRSLFSEVANKQICLKGLDPYHGIITDHGVVLPPRASQVVLVTLLALEKRMWSLEHMGFFNSLRNNCSIFIMLRQCMAVIQKLIYSPSRLSKISHCCSLMFVLQFCIKAHEK